MREGDGGTPTSDSEKSMSHLPALHAQRSGCAHASSAADRLASSPLVPPWISSTTLRKALGSLGMNSSFSSSSSFWSRYCNCSCSSRVISYSSRPREGVKCAMQSLMRRSYEPPAGGEEGVEFGARPEPSRILPGTPPSSRDLRRCSGHCLP